MANSIDLAPGWVIRCPSCGRTKPYGKYGIRLGAASYGKRTLAWCTGCRWLRFAIVEKIGEKAGAVSSGVDV